jgi:hypothetical protein
MEGTPGGVRVVSLTLVSGSVELRVERVGIVPTAGCEEEGRRREQAEPE